MKTKRILGKPNTKECKMSNIIFIVVIIIFTILQVFINLKIDSIEFFTLFLMILMILMILMFLKTKLITLIHEYCHKIMANILGYYAKVVISKEELKKIRAKTGLNLSGYCKFKDNTVFTKQDFINIALAPLFFLIMALIILQFIKFYITSEQTKIILSIISYLFTLKITGCSNDLQMVLEIRGISENDKIIYSADIYRFKVYDCSTSPLEDTE
ncbi:hypothetical protein APP_30020 [Aeribacillus pallidus]|nr:hypothetical protein APP_30020 [Aeribacillus pallidus]